MMPEGTTRRRFLRASGGAVVGGALSYGASESAVAQSDEAWAQFRYDTANTGYAAENTGPVSNIEQRWVVETGDEVWSSPSVVGGTVYVGSFDGNIYALDAADGTEQWVYRTDGSVASTPTVAMSTVVIGRRTVYIGSQQQVYALDAADGTEQWDFETGDLIGSSPVTANGTVYIGSNDNTVYALDAADGAEQWTFETGDSVQSSPAVVDGTVYVGSNDNTVYALDAADGTEQWTFETGDSVQSSPAVVDGTVYIGSWDSNVYALDAVDGTEQWAFEIGQGADISSSAAVMDGTVYVGGGESGNVYALDAGDGVEQWQWETGEVYSSPAVVNDTVFIGSYDGRVYALDANVGPDAELNPDREQWNIETNDEVWASPAVVNETVYIGSKDNRIYAFTGDASTSTGTATATERPAATATETADDPNEPPTASITVTTSEPTAGESITFDASGSTDLDGSIASYEWEIAVSTGEGGGGGLFDPDPPGTVVEYPVPADAESVEAALTVTDDDGATDTTTRTVEFDSGSTDGDGSIDALPLLVGAGTLGAVGGVAWWYRRRDSPDTETGGAPSGENSAGSATGSTSTTTASSGGPTGGASGSDSGFSDSQTSTVRSGTTGTSSESDTESSADNELSETVDRSLDEGRALRDKANEYRDAGEYTRALDTYDEAQEAYEDALETASQSALIDTDAIEQKLTTVQDQRRETHRQKLHDEVESVRMDLDSRETLADDGALEKERERLTDLESVLSSAEESAAQHGFDDLQEEIATLEQRCEKRRREVAERLQAYPVPDDMPRVPDVSVDYDALTDEEPIGGGGNADVSKAILPASDGDVTLAIKRPRMAGTLHTEAVERMLDEAETWNKLDNHDHIVGVVDYGSEPVPWIAMEYMNGGHLGDQSGQMEIPQALWTALAVTKGVRHAHRRGVAHLDLKPENVLLRAVEDGWDVPKVADWGLSKHLLTDSKSIEGMSVTYAAPEQFDDDYGPADDLTDIYQLGAVFYELFTGRPPFEGQPFKVIEMLKTDRPIPPSEIADVPEALDEILLTALAKEKDDRYDDIVYLRDDLRKLYIPWHSDRSNPTPF